MLNMKEVEKTNVKLAQFKNAICKIRFDNNTSYDTEWIFERTNSSDKKILPTKYLQLRHPELIGDTALHIVFKEHDVFKILSNKKIGLDNESRYIYDETGSSDVYTQISKIVEKHYDNLNIFADPRFKLPNLLINSMFNVYRNSQKITNISDKNGISHFHVACMANNSEMIKLYLDNGVSVDHAVKNDSPHFPGYTPLHFAVQCCSVQTVQLLLERNANLRLKDAKGMSPLHILLKSHIEFAITARKRFVLKSKEEDSDWYSSASSTHSYPFFDDCYAEDYLKLKSGKIISLFLEKYRQENMLLIDDLGLSYFHVACAMGDTKLAALKNEADLNHCINKDSPLWPGYTPLHFAALFSTIHAMKMLIKKGGDMGVKNANGVTPFDLCIEAYKTEDIHKLLSLHPVWKNISFSDGKTKLLDFVAAMTNEYDLKKFVEKLPKNFDIHIPYDSPLWPGFTLMHLAIILSKNCDEDTDYFEDLEMMVIPTIFRRSRKSLYTQNLHVSTPLDFAFRRKKSDAVRDLLSSYSSLKHYLDSVDDNQLSCLHVASATDDDSLVQQLLSWGNNVNVIYKGKPFDSVNSGWTPLHFAAANWRNSVIDVLCQSGANVLAKDTNRMTPIHLMLVFTKYDHPKYEDQKRTVDRLFSFSNFEDAVVDDIGLSHLHVACFYAHAVAIKKLVERGADINKVINYKPTADNGSTILSGLTEFDGSTPLHLALQQGTKKSVKLLLQLGADVLVKSRDAPLLRDILKNRCSELIYDSDQFFFSILTRSDDLQKRLEGEIGLTMIHVACRMDDLAMVKELLSAGSDVNAQIHTNSPIWPGYTALHTLKYGASRDSSSTNLREMIELLLDRGADVTLSNAKGRTPVHMAFKHCCELSGYENYSFASMLLKAQQDFSVNPESIEGLSHFHVACGLNDSLVVKKFLRHARIDANRPINHFTDEYRYVAGCTPLHLAVSKRTRSNVSEATSRLEIVDLLLNRGADVRAEDAYGNTPLNRAVKCNPKKCQDLLERLVRGGADLSVTNIFGKTPLEYLILMKSGVTGHDFKVTAEKIKSFLKCGGHFNEYNPATGKGLIALALSRLSYQGMRDLVAAIHMNYPNVMRAKYKGRTSIHNIVSSKVSKISADAYAALIDQLSRIDCDVDDQDDKGQTALHLAVHHQNCDAVWVLTIVGADMSIRDSSGKTAFACNPKKCLECDSKDDDSDESNDENEADDSKCHHVEIDRTLFSYALKLQLCGSYVQLLDEYFGHETHGQVKPMRYLDSDFYAQVRKIQKLKIGSSTINFGDFLSETGAVVNYSTMSSFNREAIDDFFSSNEIQSFRKKFYGVKGIIQFQYRKAVRRRKLMEASKNVLVKLTGCRLPDLCSEYVLQCLENSDLENLVASMT